MSKKNSAQNIVILGGGISGLSVSYFLKKFKIKNLIIEKKNECGGLLKSFKIKKYVFDNFIHISHAKNPIQKIFLNPQQKIVELNLGQIIFIKICGLIILLNFIFFL